MRRDRPGERPVVAAGIAALWLLGATLAPATPSWWTNVIDPAAVTNDFAAVNAGQAKWFALQAHAHLDATLTGGAGFTPDSTPTNNFNVINLGQLKQLATPHWDRLIAVGHTNAPPWTAGPEDDHDFAVANVGQLKTVFNFEVIPSGGEELDTDEDGIADDWELQYFGDLETADATTDYDGDGVLDIEEFLNGTDPTTPNLTDDQNDIGLVVLTPL